MEVGLVCFPYRVDEVVAVAEVADSAQRPLLFGLPDSPLLFADTYVGQQAVLARTQHLHVGPFATNPITRHYGIHAAVHRSLEEQYPGRSFMALAAGDSAVHSFGMSPARPEQIRAHAQGVREHGPEGFRILLAAGGLKVARGVATAGDELVFGQGLDRGAIAELSAATVAAREEAGLQAPLRRWAYVIADIWASGDGSDDRDERAAFQGMLMAYSRQAMSATYAGKNVPDHLQPRLRQLYEAFSFERYGDASNARLLERFEEEEAFLRRRFAVSGTPAEVADQINVGVADCGVDGVWIGILTRKARAIMELFIEGVLPALERKTGDP